MILFGDSAGWLAAYDERDKYHAAANLALQGLTGQNATFVVTDYVVGESITLMRSRLGHKRSVAFGEWLLTSSRVKMISPMPLR